MAHESDERRHDFITDVISGLQKGIIAKRGAEVRGRPGRNTVAKEESTYYLKDSEHGVDVPTLIRSITLCSQADLGRKTQLEFIIGNL